MGYNGGMEKRARVFEDKKAVTDAIDAIVEGGAARERALAQGWREARSARGGTLLMYCAFHGAPESWRAALGAGADPREADCAGNTALHMAATYSQHEMALALIEAGADVDARTSEGVTPLLRAMLGHGEEFAEILLEAGADPRIPNRHGVTAWSLMESSGRERSPVWDRALARAEARDLERAVPCAASKPAARI